MFKTLINIFRIPELRNKLLFTLFMLMIYRIGYHVPIPGADQQQMHKADKGGDDAGTRLANYISIFAGGNLSQSTIFGLGIMPYISASIIFQLLVTVLPALEKLQKDGETGRKKIQEWTRYAAVPICIIQSSIWLGTMISSGSVKASFLKEHYVAFWVMGLCCLTAGCVFLMWLGEQIDEYGLGNGISLIIMSGIVSRLPSIIILIREQMKTENMSPGKLVFLTACFGFVVAGSILITQAQRRIPIQQAKHTRGRRIYGGQKQYLPLRVNHGGVMPIIFAQSLMLFPSLLIAKLEGWTRPVGGASYSAAGTFFKFLKGEFSHGQFLYVMFEIVTIYFFAYFWTTVQFQPKEMSNQLRDYGSFIPGLRPGPRTADYLEKVMMRITYVGGAFLCIIAVIPTALSVMLKIDPQIAQFLGGTGLLIVVGVALDMVQRIEANLLMRNYSGFLSSGPGQKGKRIKGRQY